MRETMSETVCLPGVAERKSIELKIRDRFSKYKRKTANVRIPTGVSIK